MSNIEKTLSIIKPDAVERNLTDSIKKIFEKNNLNIKESKKLQIKCVRKFEINPENKIVGYKSKNCF